MYRRIVQFVVVLAIALGATVALGSCGTTWPRRDPTGETFPTVTGESLAGDEVTVPDDFAGQPLLLLVGYEQEAQFDLDRWAVGLDTARALDPSALDVEILELPTIPGLGARIASGFIDDGMRGGIPEEDWKTVVTLYSEASPVAKFTGNEGGNTGRILLLDRAGEVVFFHDRGFSAGQLRRLREALAGLRSASSRDG